MLPFVQRWDYSFDGTLRSLDESRQRLGIARIDYVFIHDVGRDAHGDAQPQRFREAMEGAMPALARLKAEGTIAGFGLGVNDWRVCVDALAHADLDVILLAGRYTLLDQGALPKLLPRCASEGPASWSAARSIPASSPRARGPPTARLHASTTRPRRRRSSRA